MSSDGPKAIFISGGGSGIGQAVARYFGGKGWLVGLGDINRAGMEETATMLPTGRCSIHLLDVRDRAQWAKALADFAAVSGGRLNVLFNNAGVGLGGPIGDFPADDVDTVIDINLKGVINGIQAGMTLLKATPDSCILNTGSASGFYGSAGLCVYSATKFGVRALTEALDIELAPVGIRVRDIMPGFIDTPLLNRVIPGTNATSRDRVVDAGLEFTPLSTVAELAWDAVNGDRVHTPVGKTARRLAFAARWMPGRLRKQMTKGTMAGSGSLLGR